jgi:hypothetical protein
MYHGESGTELSSEFPPNVEGPCRKSPNGEIGNRRPPRKMLPRAFEVVSRSRGALVPEDSCEPLRRRGSR